MQRRVHRMKRLIHNPKTAILYLIKKTGWLKTMPDQVYLRLIWWLRTGQFLSLKNPEGFNEKLQWLKIYDRRPEYTMMADKYRVREYIKSTIGEEYLIPLIGVWDTAEEIDFSSLPDEFVMKCNHTVGGIIVCRDKKKLDIEKAKASLTRKLKANFYWPWREWVYKDITPKIIAEQFMKDNDPDNTAGTLIDYKFYCFHGEPRFLYVGVDDISKGKKGELKLSILDMEWREAEFRRDDHKPMPFQVKKPEGFDEMVRIARILSKGIPFVRVDLYFINKRIYFSELTFYPGGGFSPFSPDEWETTIGSWIRL